MSGEVRFSADGEWAYIGSPVRLILHREVVRLTYGSETVRALWGPGPPKQPDHATAVRTEDGEIIWEEA